MNVPEVQCVFPGICHLGEGPLWHRRRLWVCDPESGESRVFWQGRMRVGGFAFCRDGSLVLCTDRGVYKLRIDEAGAPDPKQTDRLPLSLGAGKAA